jgi:hypothetical protein
MLCCTKYYWRHITKSVPSIVAVVQHVCQVTLLTSLHTHQPFVYDTKHCWRHIIKRFEFNTVVKVLRGVLLKPVFRYGKLYVAILRVRSLGSLSVVSETNEIVNCVYNQIY